MSGTRIFADCTDLHNYQLVVNRIHPSRFTFCAIVLTNTAVVKQRPLPNNDLLPHIPNPLII